MKTDAQRVKELKSRIEYLEGELKEVKDDREELRKAFKFLFRESIRILSKGNTWCMTSLVETMAKQLQNMKSWYWF